MKIPVILLLCIWSISACTTSQSSVPHFTTEPSASNPNLIKSPALSSPSQPLQTLSPTSMQTYTPPPSPTRTDTPTPTTDWTAIYQKMKSEVMTSTPAAVSEIHLSPDGEWRIELIQYGCVDIGIGVEVTNSFEQLNLVNIETGQELIVVDQLQNCEGLGAAGLGFVHWSSDSRYLYYTDTAHGVPDGSGLGWYRSLIRYDIEGGKTINLRWGPLSPDGRTMAYPDQKALVLYLWDLDLGEIARIPATFPANSPLPGIYDISWSHDGEYLLYIEAEITGGRGKSWIIQLNVATLDSTIVYYSENNVLCCINWVSDSRIQFLINGTDTQYVDLVPGGND